MDVDDDFVFVSDHFDDEDIYHENYAVTKILDALYEKMDVADVLVKLQKHLIRSSNKGSC